MEEIEHLVEGLFKGDKKAVGRLITIVENYPEKVDKVMNLLSPYLGNAHIVGITGSPGCGKSTLIDKLIDAYRKKGRKVGVILIDPSSPYTGGTFFGNRIRMQRHATDNGVFIRSMATRGKLGGLAEATLYAINVLDAYGKDIIFVETTGIGQSEMEIKNIAHTTIVIETPDSGDEIQFLKSGRTEIGDIYVVNKADKGGADYIVDCLQEMLDQTFYFKSEKGWRPPVIKTVATEGKGIEELVDKIEEHRKYLKEKYPESF
jgi:LAO/AO transport system kinase